MRILSRIGVAAALVGVPLTFLSTPWLAQAPSHPRLILSLLAGPSPYDLSGTGTGFAAGAWVDYPVRSFFLVEAGIGDFRYDPQTGTHVTYLLPEVGARRGVPVGRFFPSTGAGAGVASVLSGGDVTDLTLHVVLGIRAWLSPRPAVRVEERLRSVDPWSGNMVGLTGGLAVRT
jgi:hypothetical protein